jgi:hypothetical protein
MIIAVGWLFFFLSWGLYRGHLWAWGGSVILTIPITMLTIYALLNDEYISISSWSRALLFLFLTLHLMLWWRSVRRWFFQSHRLRANGYQGLKLPGDQKHVTPEV